MSRPSRRAASKKIDYSSFDLDSDQDSDFKERRTRKMQHPENILDADQKEYAEATNTSEISGKGTRRTTRTTKKKPAKTDSTETATETAVTDQNKEQPLENSAVIKDPSALPADSTVQQPQQVQTQPSPQQQPNVQDGTTNDVIPNNIQNAPTNMSDAALPVQIEPNRPSSKEEIDSLATATTLPTEAKSSTPKKSRKKKKSADNDNDGDGEFVAAEDEDYDINGLDDDDAFEEKSEEKPKRKRKSKTEPNESKPSKKTRKSRKETNEKSGKSAITPSETQSSEKSAGTPTKSKQSHVAQAKTESEPMPMTSSPKKVGLSKGTTSGLGGIKLTDPGTPRRRVGLSRKAVVPSLHPR
jgi:hypothetical protein